LNHIAHQVRRWTFKIQVSLIFTTKLGKSGAFRGTFQPYSLRDNTFNTACHVTTSSSFVHVC